MGGGWGGGGGGGVVFFFNDTATTEIYTLSLHDALPILMDVPAIKGIGGSLIYFIDQYYDTSPYNAEFDWEIGRAHV